MAQLTFIHHAAHGTQSQEVGIGDEHSERLLDDMEASFPFVSMESSYPAWKNCSFFHYIIDWHISLT